jgi:hypothetical protein
MDKAKKMAEQAQAKLDEVQGQINSKQGQQHSGPVVEYDKHGRPIQPAPVTPDAPPVAAPAAAAPEPPATPGVPPTEPAGAGPGSADHSRRASHPLRGRAAEALQRGSAGGLTLRECASCAPTKAC